MPPRAMRARTRYRPSTSRPMRGSACGVFTKRVYEERAVSPGNGAPQRGFDPVTNRVSGAASPQRCQPTVRLLLPLAVAVREGRDLHGLRGIGELLRLPAGDVQQHAARGAVRILRADVEDPDAAIRVQDLRGRAPALGGPLLEESQ